MYPPQQAIKGAEYAQTQLGDRSMFACWHEGEELPHFLQLLQSSGIPSKEYVLVREGSMRLSADSQSSRIG
jgi:hypothetical protein